MAAQDWVGRVIDGRYVVEALVGRGGMGVVLAARHKFTGARVAVKMVRRDLGLDTEIEARFLAEARVPETIGHRSVVKTLDAGKTPEGELYLVMELLSGRSLRHDIMRGVGAPSVRRIGMELLDVLAAAHARGIVHRDVKPENVFLVDPDAAVKLLDFGITKVLAGPRSILPRTGAGVLLGTIEYMAPEQLADASGVDARADLWAVSVILYEMLAGRRPHRATSVQEMFVALIRGQPDPIRMAMPSASPDIEAFFIRALERDPARRFASAAEMAVALARLPLAASAPVAARPASGNVTMATGFAGTAASVGHGTPGISAAPVPPAHGVSAGGHPPMHGVPSSGVNAPVHGMPPGGNVPMHGMPAGVNPPMLPSRGNAPVHGMPGSGSNAPVYGMPAGVNPPVQGVPSRGNAPVHGMPGSGSNPPVHGVSSGGPAVNQGARRVSVDASGGVLTPFAAMPAHPPSSQLRSAVAAVPTTGTIASVSRTVEAPAASLRRRLALIVGGLATVAVGATIALLVVGAGPDRPPPPPGKPGGGSAIASAGMTKGSQGPTGPSAAVAPGSTGPVAGTRQSPTGTSTGEPRATAGRSTGGATGSPIDAAPKPAQPLRGATQRLTGPETAGREPAAPSKQPRRRAGEPPPKGRANELAARLGISPGAPSTPVPSTPVPSTPEAPGPADPASAPALTLAPVAETCAAGCKALAACRLGSSGCEANCAQNATLLGCLQQAGRDCTRFASCWFASSCRGVTPSGTRSCSEAMDCEARCRNDPACICSCIAGLAPRHAVALLAYNGCALQCRDNDCIVQRCAAQARRCRAE